MTNIPQNTGYQNVGNTPIIPKGYKYTPNTTYQNLAQLKASGASPFAPAPTPVPGTFEYDQAKQAEISKYGNLVNSGMGIPTQTQFLPPVTSPEIPIQIPSDYGTFAPPATIEDSGIKLSWGTPTSPVIKNIQGDVPGQYVEDVKNPSLLVKTLRGNNPTNDQSIRDGRPGFMYQIDHIMPLSLGGADTLANRELLTSAQNDRKTRAQAVPYTLYAHGDISLSEARAMAMQWKNRDLTDVPQPNDVGLVPDTGGRTGIEIARDAAARWMQPKKETLKEKIGKLPEMAKNFGEGWMPDQLREFVKGATSGFSLGFVPYEQDENEAGGSWLAGKIGQVVGGVASFMTGEALLSGALKAGGMAVGALRAYKGVSTAKALEAGFKAAEAGATLAEGANVAKTAGTTFNTLNKLPTYLQKVLTPQTIKRVGKLGATNVLIGQGAQLVANKFNPTVLSGQGFVKDQENLMGNMFKDMAIGAVSGIGSPTLKGTAYATMLPLTLTYLDNPDDPLDAITNGVIFGAMHVVGTAKTPGFNDVKMFGGKPYENPVLTTFEETANHASYNSLSHYAPDVLPSLKQGETVPAAAHLPETVQAAKDKAIENVWKRFFFGKDANSEMKQKTLEQFKGFSTGLEKGIEGSSIPELKGFSRLSLSARKARTAKVKEANTELAKQYGKDYQKRTEPSEDMSGIQGEGMDLQTALTEIKRITVAARQLYKGGLTRELRNQADVDDLLSFGKNNLQGRFDSMEKFANPPIAKQAVDSIDESFMKHSFNNDASAPSGKYPNGDVALTGAALNVNKEKAKYFFDQKERGNASPNILLVDRSDTAPLWRMGNELIDPAEIKSNNRSTDPNPDNALQAFGVVKNPQTGQKELVELGWVASDFRLNKATGKGHTAFNQHPLVKKYIETEGAEGMRPIDLHKDQIAPTMRNENISVLVANLDPRATFKTIESGNPFIPVNLKDANWEYSKKLGDRLSQQENQNPISMEIAKVNSAMGAKQKATAIAEMNKKTIKPASAYIPPPRKNVNPKTDRISIPQENTRTLVQTLEQSLDVASPAQIKESFKNNFGMLLEDSQAAEIFRRKNEMTMRDGVNMLVSAVNNGNIDVATKLKLQFAKTYLQSGALQSTPGGKAVPDMLLLGKRQNSSLMGPEGSTEVPVQPPLMEVNNTVKTTAAPAMGSIQKITSPQAPRATITKLEDRIVSGAKRELPTSNKIKTASDELYLRAKSLIDASEQRGGGLHEPINPDTLEYDPGRGGAAKMAKNLLSMVKSLRPVGIKGQKELDVIRKDIEPQLVNDITLKIKEVFDMPEKDARAVVDKVTNVRFNESGEVDPKGNFDAYGKEITSTVGKVAPKEEKKVGFFDKDLLTNVSEYDVLKRRRDLAADDLFKWIKQGKENSEPGTYSHAFGFALDSELASKFGKNYMNNSSVKQVLGRAFGNEGRVGRQWKNLSETVDTTKDMRPFSQSNEFLNALATGSKKTKEQARLARMKELEQTTSGQGGTLSDEELAQLGFEPGGEGNGFEGMSVISPTQENMIEGMSRGDFQFLPGLSSISFAEAAETGPSAVRKGIEDARNVLQFIVKNNNDAVASARKFGATNQKFLTLTPDKGYTGRWENLSQKEKTNISDKTEIYFNNIFKEYMKRLKTQEDKKAKLTIKDGGGGPGVHDGKGGIGDMFGNILKAVRSPFVQTFTYEAPVPKKEEKKIANLDLKKFLSAIASNETSVIPELKKYSSSQHSGIKKYGSALGKYRITEAELNAYAPRYLGKKVTKEEFLASPEIQDKYLTQKALTLSKQGYTPQDIADIHNRGMTNSFPPGSGRYQNPDYVKKFNAIYNATSTSI